MVLILQKVSGRFQRAIPRREDCLVPLSRYSGCKSSILPKPVCWKDHVRMKLWAWDEKNLPSITHAIRTATAATVSVVIARLAQMPEAYWAAIATLVVMQSTLGCNANALDQTDRRYRDRRISRSTRGKFFWREPRRVRGRDCSHRITLDSIVFVWRGLRIATQALPSPSSF